jgi:hypothetical protein
MRKNLLLTSLTLFFSFSAAFGVPPDPLMGKRVVEKVDLAFGSTETGKVFFFTMKEGEVVSYGSFNGVPFVKGSKLAAGNVEGFDYEELLVGVPKEAKHWDFYKGSLQVIENKGDTFKRIASYAYGISKYDAIVTAYPTSKRFKTLVIRGNAKKDTLEVYDLDRYLLSKINVGFERYDRLAAGDVDGDGADEVIFGDANKNRLVVYEIVKNELLSKRFISNRKIGLIDREDRLACGDVDGDGKEEIIYLNGKRGRIFFLDERGKVKRVVRAAKDAVALTSGDLDGDGFAEVFWINPKREKIEGGHLVPTYRGLKWKYFTVKGVKAGEDDVLVTGDFRNTKLVLGEPFVKTITLKQIPVVVINDPPKEKSLFGPPNEALGKFFATYEHSKSTDSTTKVELKSSVSFSHTIKGEKRPLTSLFLRKVKYNIERTVSKSIEEGNYKRIVETVEEGLSADGYQDKAVVLISSYYAFFYPILSPKELAYVNGKQQYLLVTVPKATVKRIGVIYKSPVHLTGFVGSYPQHEDELYHYSPDNVIARGEMVISCGETRIGYTKVKETGMSSQSSIGSSTVKEENGQLRIPLYSTVKKLLPVNPSNKRSSKKEYYSFKVESHDLYLTDVNAIAVKSLGNWSWCSEQDKRYTVGVVVYTDSEDGHLIIDYYVPERGSYYKPPPKLNLPPAPLLLNPKSGKPLNFRLKL